jgi:hypothetical protein
MGKGKRVKTDGLTLALFQTRVFLVDDINTTLPTDNLAVRSTAFDGSANSHIKSLKIGEMRSARGDKNAFTR